jgi:hypothetical protein
LETRQAEVSVTQACQGGRDGVAFVVIGDRETGQPADHLLHLVFAGGRIADRGALDLGGGVLVDRQAVELGQIEQDASDGAPRVSAVERLWPTKGSSMAASVGR